MKEFIFCVDSDGTAIDTMTFKHMAFMGPNAVKVFGIKDVPDFMAKWEQINLMSRHRGVNRFEGLVRGLEAVHYPGIDNLRNWVWGSKALNKDTLQEEIDRHGTDDLKKAMEWTLMTDEGIKSYDGDYVAFQGVAAGLEKLAEHGDIYVVSTANEKTISTEWKHFGFDQHVTDYRCQESGPKKVVIDNLIAEGADPNKMMMIGDSPGDLDAAVDTALWFYPIRVGHEQASWDYLRETVADAFVKGELTDEDREQFKKIFWENLES